MCDGMRIDRRLILVGVLLIVLSMTMATQYATTKVGYTFGIVHPSESDIRFIGSDNSSDNIRLLRVSGTNGSSDVALTLSFGNITAGQNKTYSAAFGIVNEEAFKVNITHINVSADTGTDYLKIWLHGDRDASIDDDGTSVEVWDWQEGGNRHSYGSSDCVWQLGAGDGTYTDLDGGSANTEWDERAHVMYSTYNTNAVNSTDDYVWIQISIKPPDNADTSASYAGEIWIHTAASTEDQ